MHTRAASLIAVGIALTFSTPSQAQGPDDLWEVKANITMDGMRLPGMPTKVCSKGTQVNRMAPMDKNCKTSDVKTVGNHTTFRIVCAGKDPMTGTGEMTTGKGSYHGTLKLNGTVDGEKSTMVTEYSGKLIGKCTAK